MEWKRASRRSLLEACLASSSRILATQAANSFCSVDGGRIAAIFSKADLLIMRVITPVARFCITLLSALTSCQRKILSTCLLGISALICWLIATLRSVMAASPTAVDPTLSAAVLPKLDDSCCKQQISCAGERGPGRGVGKLAGSGGRAEKQVRRSAGRLGAQNARFAWDDK